MLKALKEDKYGMLITYSRVKDAWLVLGCYKEVFEMMPWDFQKQHGGSVVVTELHSQQCK